MVASNETSILEYLGILVELQHVLKICGSPVRNEFLSLLSPDPLADPPAARACVRTAGATRRESGGSESRQGAPGIESHVLFCVFCF